MMRDLLSDIQHKRVKIGILGQGYVGLPLALTFAKKFTVIGYDINEKMIEQLKRGSSPIDDIDDMTLVQYLNKTYYPSNNPDDLKQCCIFIICVPTPLTADKLPNLAYIKSACDTIAGFLLYGHFIVLESTTYPGTTEEVVVPILEETGLKAGIDFGVAYSPERIDPGNHQFTVEKIPKVIGGISEECTDIAAALYGQVIEKIVRVKNARTAESVKMVENIFRNVNIALVNELSLIFEKMNVDTWEVIDGAATKPYGYMPFYPGPGVGGHCIPLDPFYLSYKAKKFGFIPRFIDTSAEINEFMKMHVINLGERGLKSKGKSIYKAKISVFGLAYKKNINDVRESPAIEIIDELINLGAEVRVFDPHIASITTKKGIFTSERTLPIALDGADCAIFLVDHDEFCTFDQSMLHKKMRTPVVVDCKNIIQRNEHIVYLGIGKVLNL
jgi:UDP-N-acetyl-D-glucosamine dehydrogenase